MSDPDRKACRNVEDQLSAYLDDELDPKGRSEVEGHIRDCLRCASLQGDLRSVVRSVAAVPTPAPSPGFKQRTMDKIRMEGGRQAPRTAPAWLRIGAVGLAASFLIILTLSVSGIIGGPRYLPAELARLPAKNEAARTIMEQTITDETAVRTGGAVDNHRGIVGGRVDEVGLDQASDESAGLQRETDDIDPGRVILIAESEAPRPARSKFKNMGVYTSEDLDAYSDFLSNTPETQAVYLSYQAGTDARKAIDKLVASFQLSGEKETAPSEEKEGAAAPDRIGAKFGEEPDRPAEGKRSYERRDGELAFQKWNGTAPEEIQAQVTLQQYADFRMALEKLEGVIEEDGPERQRWLANRRLVIGYLKKTQDADKQDLGDRAGAVRGEESALGKIARKKDRDETEEQRGIESDTVTRKGTKIHRARKTAGDGVKARATLEENKLDQQEKRVILVIQIVK
ncbi:MAG: zf-HC2 domain-containing protein [Planctomycetota bacterium]|nr:zf-HC2 domain-containing protein [Planctomycetota bacterium]